MKVKLYDPEPLSLDNFCGIRAASFSFSKRFYNVAPGRFIMLIDNSYHLWPCKAVYLITEANPDGRFVRCMEIGRFTPTGFKVRLTNYVGSLDADQGYAPILLPIETVRNIVNGRLTLTGG